MQLGNITVHSSLSRDCSDILVSGSLKATLVQAEMPLRLRFWICPEYPPFVCIIMGHHTFAGYYGVPNSRACTAIYLRGKCSPTRPYYALHAY